MKILVVDDDSRICKMTAEALRDHGHEVAEADCGESALALLDGIDVLLTDVQMPGIDGPALADIATARFPNLTVYFMSGDTGTIPYEAFRGRPILAKPFTLSALLGAVAS